MYYSIAIIWIFIYVKTWYIVVISKVKKNTSSLIRIAFLSYAYKYTA